MNLTAMTSIGQKFAGFLGVVLFASLFFPPEVFAILTITEVSPTNITSSDDVITLTATASGLTNSTQYLQAAFSKEGQAPNYLGFTKNNKDEWRKYESSPVLADLFSFVPANGGWSGQVLAKIDTSDSGYKGAGNYTVRLLKYVSSPSSHTDSNVMTTAVNVPSTQTPEASEQTPSETIDWSTVSQAKLGEGFTVSATLKNFSANTDYYLKIRGGLSESELSKAQTQKGSQFLSDSDSWSKFPLVSTDQGGSWSGEIYARVANDKPEGDYLLKVRVRDRAKRSNYDSDSKSVRFVKTVVSSDSIQEEKTSDSEGKQSTRQSVKKASVLGNKTATEAGTTAQATVNLGVFYSSPEAGTDTEAPKNQAQSDDNFLNNLLPWLGIALTGAGLSIVLKFRHDSHRAIG